MKRQAKARRSGPSGIRRAWTIVCLLFVCTVALLARGVLIYRLYPLEYEDTIAQYSRAYEIDPYLVCAMIRAESSFDPDAVSGDGAVGLMQVLPSTGEWVAGKIGMDDYTEDTLSDPEVNIRIGCWYLHYLSGLFDGNTDHMVAAYNAGQNNVLKWIESDDGLNNIPFPETEKYLDKVNAYYEIYKGLYNFS
jgi:soluble lytic murein transglycosylase